MNIYVITSILNVTPGSLAAVSLNYIRSRTSLSIVRALHTGGPGGGPEISRASPSLVITVLLVENQAMSEDYP